MNWGGGYMSWGGGYMSWRGRIYELGRRIYELGRRIVTISNSLYIYRNHKIVQLCTGEVLRPIAWYWGTLVKSSAA